MTEDTRDGDPQGLEESHTPIDPHGSDALDRAISAAMDDALPHDEFEALRERIAEEPEVAARVRAFHAIDAGVRRLADEASDGVDSAARDEAGFADLQARLDRGSRVAWLRRGAPVIAALAAAAAVLFFLQTRQPGENGEPSDTKAPVMVEVDGTPSDLVDPVFDDMLDETFAEDLEEELSVALGYGDEIDILPDVRVEDFEVVDQLDLLDFLAEQDLGGRG